MIFTALQKYLNSYRDRIRDFARDHTAGAKTKWWLFVVAFTESSFFLIPPDIFLISILMVLPERFLYYAGLTTIASVFGGVLGYLIGFFFFEIFGRWIINTYNLVDAMVYVGRLFSDNAFWTIFISAFTPVPYKVFTISAGVFKIDFLVFLVASFLGRGLRFYILGVLMYWFGPVLGRVLYRYFNWLMIVLIMLIISLLFYFYLQPIQV